MNRDGRIAVTFIASLVALYYALNNFMPEKPQAAPITDDSAVTLDAVDKDLDESEPRKPKQEPGKTLPTPHTAIPEKGAGGVLTWPDSRNGPDDAQPSDDQAAIEASDKGPDNDPVWLDATWANYALKERGPVLIYFSGEVCEPCRRFERNALDLAEAELADRYTLLRDKSFGASPIAQAFLVGQVPTVVVVSGSRILIRLAGPQLPRDPDSLLQLLPQRNP